MNFIIHDIFSVQTVCKMCKSCFTQPGSCEEKQDNDGDMSTQCVDTDTRSVVFNINLQIHHDI